LPGHPGIRKVRTASREPQLSVRHGPLHFRAKPRPNCGEATFVHIERVIIQEADIDRPEGFCFFQRQLNTPRLTSHDSAMDDSSWGKRPVGI
jgi:hypothetical protein